LEKAKVKAVSRTKSKSPEAKEAEHRAGRPRSEQRRRTVSVRRAAQRRGRPAKAGIVRRPHDPAERADLLADSVAATSVLDLVKYDERGLVPVIAQEADGTVLMLAWANRAALEETLTTGRGTYWSRSRQELWRKGDTSGHRQEVSRIAVDCDGDSVLYTLRQTGPACHTGAVSCFFTSQEI
jgi:phosphoribosyl-AMP cyclohydrolase